MRPLVLAVAAVCILVGLAAPAHAGPDDLEFARRLSEVGYHDLARKVYEEVLERDWSDAAEKDAARYGLVLLHRARALDATRRDVSYREVRALFTRAYEALDAFALAMVDPSRVDQARLDRSVLQLAFAHWVAEALREEGTLAPRQADADTVRAHAREDLEAALDTLETLRSRSNEVRAHAGYYHAVGLHYGALLEPGCTASRQAALRMAGHELEAFIMAHDGQLLAVYAQEVYGVVWTELARCEQDPAKRHACLDRAVEWFETCIFTDDQGPEFLRVIANGYVRLARLALEAEPSSTRDYARDALLHLEAMLERHPGIWRIEAGLRAMLEHARLASRAARSQRALDLAVETADRAAEGGLDAMARVANRELRTLLLQPAGDSPTPHVDPRVAQGAADDAFSHGAYEDAIGLYRRVITSSPHTAEAFLAHRWHAWEQMARCYKRLGDRLGEALAYEPIHEAWMRGAIPWDKENRVDPLMTRAENNRRSAQVAYRCVASATGSGAFARREDRIGDAFRREYPSQFVPSHGSWNWARRAWNEALQQKAAGDSGWTETLVEVRECLRAITQMERSQKQDVAWVYLVRCDFVESRFDVAILTAAEALAWWSTPRATARTREFESVRIRRRHHKGAVLYWMARSQHELRRHAEALDTLDGWHAAYPELASPYPELGYDLIVQAGLAANRPEVADAAWQELLRLHPEYKRLGHVAFLLADRHNKLRDVVQDQLREVTKALNDTRKGFREAEREHKRLVHLRGRLESDLDRLRRWREYRIADGLPTDSLDEEIRRIQARLEKVEDSQAEWAERLGPLQASAIAKRQAKDRLEERLYEPLLGASRYYLAWILAIEEHEGEVDPENVFVFAALYWTLANLRPEVVELWETTRMLYERFLAMDAVRKRPATDPDVRLANERIGIALVRLAQQK